MNTFLIFASSVIALVILTRFALGRWRAWELDRDFVLDLSCGHDRALIAAATAARGVLWQVEFTDYGLRTRHIHAKNVIHVTISPWPDRPGRSCAKVWARYTWVDAVLILRPRSFTDTRRKRDKIVRALAAHAVATPRSAAHRG